MSPSGGKYPMEIPGGSVNIAKRLRIIQVGRKREIVYLAAKCFGVKV